MTTLLTTIALLCGPSGPENYNDLVQEGYLGKFSLMCQKKLIACVFKNRPTKHVRKVEICIGDPGGAVSEEPCSWQLISDAAFGDEQVLAECVERMK